MEKEKQMVDAVTKIQSEMNVNKNNEYITFIGAFLLQHLEKNPADAVHLLNGGKTIAKSLDAMRSLAQKKKVGNFAMFTPSQGCAIVLEYFGITKADVDSETLVTPSVPTVARKKFSVSLDDLI